MLPVFPRTSRIITCFVCANIGLLAFYWFNWLSYLFSGFHSWVLNDLGVNIGPDLLHLQVFMADTVLFFTCLILLLIVAGLLFGGPSLLMSVLLGWVLIYDRIQLVVVSMFSDRTEIIWYSPAGGLSVFGALLSCASLVIAFWIAIAASRKFVDKATGSETAEQD